jgi:hypothetical protein
VINGQHAVADLQEKAHGLLQPARNWHIASEQGAPLPQAELRQMRDAHHLGFSRDKRGKNQAGAITEHELVVNHERLEMLGFAGRGTDGDFLCAQQGVDCRAFAHVRVANLHIHSSGQCMVK